MLTAQMLATIPFSGYKRLSGFVGVGVACSLERSCNEIPIRYSPFRLILRYTYYSL